MKKNNKKNVIKLKTMVEDKSGMKEELEALVEAEHKGSISSLVLISKEKGSESYRVFGFARDTKTFAELNLLIDTLKAQLIKANMHEVSYEESRQ